MKKWKPIVWQHRKCLNQEPRSKIKTEYICMLHHTYYSFLTLPPEKSSDPGGKENQGTKRMEHKPGIFNNEKRTQKTSCHAVNKIEKAFS